VMKIVFLSSGGGGNLRFIKKCIDETLLENCEVVAVISDRQCRALDFAAKESIANYQIAYNRIDNRELLELLLLINPDYIVTNIHKILDSQIVGLFNNRLINLHYSLLPAFKGGIGETPVREALKLGCKFIGTTVHFVNDDVDSGEIITQTVIPVVREQLFEKTMEDIFKSGCINLLSAIDLLCNGKGNDIDKYSVFNEQFWEAIK
jgi:phosphoribosylglycinamide formyltransferase-1